MNSVIPYTGGKRMEAAEIAEYIRPHLKGRYIEPFVGAGSVFLKLNYDNPELDYSNKIGDIVPELINMYNCIRDNYERVIWHLDRLDNNERLFYLVRDMDRSPFFNEINRYFRAARFIYLAKTGFRSIRFNQYGQANIGYGNHPDRLPYSSKYEYRMISRLLNQTEICLLDFRETLGDIQSDDVVYLDPPVETKRFNSFWSKKFIDFDSEIIKAHCQLIDRKGAKFFLTYKNNERIKDQYRDFQIIPLKGNHNTLITNT